MTVCSLTFSKMSSHMGFNALKTALLLLIAEFIILYAFRKLGYVSDCLGIDLLENKPITRNCKIIIRRLLVSVRVQ